MYKKMGSTHQACSAVEALRVEILEAARSMVQDAARKPGG
jgi:hypothetical protein